jgi:hypothetical protein
MLLGRQTVGFDVDRDVINVNQDEDWFRNRSFRALRFMAERNDVYMMSVRVVYLNGFSEDFRIDQLIQQGRDIELDLRGERSYIRQIEMIYRSRPDFRGQAIVSVYGDPVRRGTPVDFPTGSAGWVELGCQQVNLIGRDRDVIQVGRRDGRFKAIRLAVRGADVEMLDLRVIYADGRPDDIPVKNLIRAGERTRPLDLDGWERAIDRIEMTYRTVLNPGNIIIGQGLRTATVCVEGQR